MLEPTPPPWEITHNPVTQEYGIYHVRPDSVLQVAVVGRPADARAIVQAMNTRPALTVAIERALWILANCVGTEPPANWAALAQDAERAYRDLRAATEGSLP